VRNGPSRSSKVVDFGTSRKHLYDFLLVIYSNLGPILLRFRDIAGFLLRTTPPSSLFWYSAVNSRSMTPITWQAAVNDEEQRPLLQVCKTSLKQPSMTGVRRQLTSKNSGHSCKISSKQPSMGIMFRENSRGGFPLPSSRFLPSSVLLLDSVPS